MADLTFVKKIELPGSNQAEIDAWEEECKRISAEAESKSTEEVAERKTLLVKEGAMTNGSSVRWEDHQRAGHPLPEGDEVVEYQGAWGPATCWWAIEEVRKVNRVKPVFPPQPKYKEGWENRPDQIASLLNEEYGFNWTWFDVPSDKKVKNWNRKVKSIGEWVEKSVGDPEIGYRWFKGYSCTFVYEWYIFTNDGYEIWEEEKQGWLGGGLFSINDKSTLKPWTRSTSCSTSRDSDGFWNK